MKTQQIFSTALVLAITAATGSPVWAQEEEAEPDIEEVIVTARFREESVQDIGQSIAVLGADELNKEVIVDFEDIARRVAGVELLNGGSNRNEVTIRGIANGINANGRDAVEPLVSMYIDDISVAAAGSGITRDINLYDMSRVEILRGPQPTLFGEGSVGGVIRYFTQDPVLDGDRSFEGNVNADISHTDSGGTNYRVETANSFTLIPNELGVRLMASYRDDAGYIDNLALGTDNVNDLESLTGRAVVLWRPNDDWTVRIAATLQRDEIGEFNEISSATVGDSINKDDLIAPLFNTFDGLQEDNYSLFSGKITWHGDNLTVESITGYYEREILTEILDSGLTVGLPVFFNAVGLNAWSNIAGYDPTSIREVNQDAETWSQEFRFISNLDGPLNFTAGLFYQNSDTLRQSLISGPGYPDITVPPTALVSGGDTDVNSKQYSGFLELTWGVSETFRLIGGVRYVNETITNTLLSSVGINLFAPVVTGPPGVGEVLFTVPDDLEDLAAEGLTDPTFEFELDEWLPRFGFEYDASDTALIYGNYAEGLRNGGQNSILAARAGGAVGSPEFFDVLFFDPDEAKSAEIGWKSMFHDGDLLLNVAAYYTKYENPQIFVGTPIRGVANAPDQDIFGMELETAYNFNENVEAYFAGAYTSAEYSESGTALPVAGGPPGFQDIAEGNKAQSVPEWSFSTGVNMVYPTGWSGTDFLGRINYNYVGSRYTTAQNFPTSKIGSLNLLNLRLGLESDRWTLVAYVNNLLNDLELANVIAAPNGAVLVNGVLDTPAPTTVMYVNKPRTAGVRLTFHY